MADNDIKFLKGNPQERRGVLKVSPKELVKS